MIQRVLSGIQPTGQLHLGNYLGAIRNWVIEQTKHESLFCIVDLHAVTLPQDPVALRHNTRLTAAIYLACGIDPKTSIIFNQAQIPAHSELAWLLGCMTPLGWLNRMTQFKDKAGKNREKAGLGLYAYPVLMAADILIYKASYVPVGDDQKQHLELARDIAGMFNHKYKQEFFPIPEPQILGVAPRVMSLRDGSMKMSKSDPSDYSRIHLTDSADEIVQKIRKARTDPEPLPESAEALEGRLEAKNLVTIYAALANISVNDVCKQYAGAQFSDFKPVLSDLLISCLQPISAQVQQLMDNQDELDKVLAIGAEKANAIAVNTVCEVHELMGFLKTKNKV